MWAEVTIYIRWQKQCCQLTNRLLTLWEWCGIRDLSGKVRWWIFIEYSSSYNIIRCKQQSFRFEIMRRPLTLHSPRRRNDCLIYCSFHCRWASFNHDCPMNISSTNTHSDTLAAQSHSGLPFVSHSNLSPSICFLVLNKLDRMHYSVSFYLYLQ